MSLKLDLRGVLFELHIYGYHPSSKGDLCFEWCKTDFSVKFKNCLSYTLKNDELFMSFEIDEFANKLKALLHDEMKDDTEMICMEPDFRFLFHTKKDLRKDRSYVFVKKGHEFTDISMEWITTFWDEGLTDHYLSLEFRREDIQQLLDYLNSVMEKGNDES
jgi:hypothetical protein